MLRFKREIKGYWHFHFLEVLLVHKMLTEDQIDFWLRILDGVTFGIVTILLLRFVLTPYLVFNETELLIKRDLFISRAINVNEIREVKFGKGGHRYRGEIELKDGSRFAETHANGIL